MDNWPSEKLGKHKFVKGGLLLSVVYFDAD